MSAQGEAAARPTRLGRYELITRIGQGGMAEVQLALQRGPAGFEKLVVVKLVHDSLATQKAFVDMLLDEARVAALVKHPNVVDIYDLGQAGGRYFIAMEYLEGEPLLAVLRAGREGKRLDALSTGRMIADTAEGLDAAHELRSMSGERIELVHHDISLGNIVVLYNGQVKLVDFGVAKASQSTPSKSKVQGKFSYMAPEKLRGAPGDRRSDIFSLGCVMWEALTLRRLFRGSNDGETMRQVLEMTIQPPSKINGDVPPEYDPIVLRALDRDPARRHMTAKELAVEIEELLRKRGYGAKNDKIARYMQETFKAHIEARKKLVQEVVSKGSASAEVVDAAFADTTTLVAQGSPMPAHESLDFIATPADGVPTTIARGTVDTTGATLVQQPAFDARDLRPSGSSAEWRSGSVDDAQVAADASDGAKTVVAPPLVIDPADQPDAEPESDDAPTWRKRLHTAGTRLRAQLTDPRRRILALIGAAGLVVLVVELAILATRSNSGTPIASAHVASDSSGSSAAGATGALDAGAIVTTGSGSGSAGVAERGSGVSVDDIVIDDDHAPKRPHHDHGTTDHDRDHGTTDHDRDHATTDHDHAATDHPHTHAAPPVDVEALTQKGVQAYVKGDLHGALALLQKARAARPGYAPTWRVLGQVYEKLGDHAQAKNAFLRYLSLAPNASDAPQIRQRLEHTP